MLDNEKFVESAMLMEAAPSYLQAYLLLATPQRVRQ